jgi:hypothetical protein
LLLGPHKTSLIRMAKLKLLQAGGSNVNSMVSCAASGDNTEKVWACPVWKLTRGTGGARTGYD